MPFPKNNSLLPSSISKETLEISEFSVADLLHQQAALTPDADAIVAGEIHLTYLELSTAANRLAHYLQTFGVAPEHRMALLLPR